MTRVVLADDHPFLRTGVEGALGSMGIEIAASVESGEAALEAIERENPDVAILDVRMPGMGGVAVLEALRTKGDNRPVILLTAEIEDAALLTAVKAKVDGIVFKDGAETQLEEAIKAVLAGERFIDQALMQRALDLAIENPQAFRAGQAVSARTADRRGSGGGQAQPRHRRGCRHHGRIDQGLSAPDLREARGQLADRTGGAGPARARPLKRPGEITKVIV